MAPWLIHALLGVIASGAYVALLKVPGSRGHNKYAYQALGFLVAAILAAYVYRGAISLDARTLFLSALWGGSFAFIAMMQMELLKTFDTSSIFPLTSLSSQALVVIIGLSFFHDVVSPMQWAGLILSFLIISLYRRVHTGPLLERSVVQIMALLVLLSTFGKFVQKFGAIHVQIENFIFWQLFFVALVSIGIWLWKERKKLSGGMRVSRPILWWSLALGVTNFFSASEIIQALSTGPFSLVNAVGGFYLIFMSVLAWWWFGEALSRRKILLLLAAIGSVVLIGLG